jgi:hypothetical protein
MTECFRERRRHGRDDGHAIFRSLRWNSVDRLELNVVAPSRAMVAGIGSPLKTAFV